MKRFSLLFILMLVLTGCTSKKVEYKVIKAHIPESLLSIPYIDTNRSIKNEIDISMFMLDIYEAYSKCTMQLNGIKRINDGR